MKQSLLMKYKKKTLTVVLTGAIVSLINGCAISKSAMSSINETNTNVDTAEKQYESSVSVANRNFVRHVDTVYFGSSITAMRNANLPPSFSSDIRADQTFTSMTDIADGISRLTGLKVLVQSKSKDSANFERPIRVSQINGTVSDLLDNIAAKADISWVYQDGVVLLQQTETRTWSINNLPGNLQMQNQMTNTSGLSSTGGTAGSASSGGGSSGGQAGTSSSATGNTQTNQSVQFSYNGDYWASLDKAITKMVSPEVGSFSINDQTSSITVNDRPSVLAKINDYINTQNELMSRQVVVDIQVLSVETDGTDNYGINWNIALAGTDAAFSMNGQATQAGSAAGAFLPSPVFLPTSTTQAFTVSAKSGSLSGSQLIVNALSTMSRVSNVYSTAAVTLSNQPVPLNFTDQISYLASVQNTISGQSSLSQVSLTPGQMTVGFSLNVLPVIKADGTVLLQTSISISNLKQMAQYSSGGSSIQLPTVGNRSFMQKTAIRSGDTFVVTGFDGDLNALTQTGVGDSSFWLLGGGVSASKKKSRLVILLTPRVVLN